MASFIVEKDGQLSDVQVVGAEDPRTADQIAGVINSLPPWQAGVQDGQPVRVQMRVPLK
ncbi:MAG: energy transducer TonB [Flavobacteriales bacterium]|nr:energy transducer TonB [Flavobacteriales bacterium]